MWSDEQGVRLDGGSLYIVEFDETSSDRIETTGKAALGGGFVALNPTNGSTLGPREIREQLGRSFVILTAGGGIDGHFDERLLPQYAFIGAGLSYGRTEITVDIARNGLSFADAGRTKNQRAVGAAIEGLDEDDPVYKSLLESVTLDVARAAETELAGEIHADAVGQALSEGRRVQDTITDRLWRRSQTDADRVWMKAMTGFGHSSGDGNAAEADRDVWGFVIGADRAVDNWVLGATAGFLQAATRTDRLGTVEQDSYHLGLYGQGQFGSIIIGFGGTYGFLDLSTRRAAFDDRLQADSDARQAQVFGEVAYRLSWEEIALEPFAGAGWTHVDFDGFRERGGDAALQGGAMSVDQAGSTLGVRVSTMLQAEDGSEMRPSLSIGWRHVFGDIVQDRDLHFASAPSGSRFDVSGVPDNRDSAVVSAGFDATLGGGLRFGFSYDGDLGDRTQDHAFTAKLNYSF